MHEVTITVDVQERRSRVPEALDRLGVHATLVTLAGGDYAIGGRVVERKAVADLHQTLSAGRLWEQVAALRRDPRRAYLMIEGADIDDGPVPPRPLRGALLKIMDNGIRIVQTGSPEDTALWLHVLARQEARRSGSRTSAGVGRRPLVVSPVGLLSAIPGVGVESARELLLRFGSITDIAGASERDLCAIRGIGPDRARAIVRALT